MRPIPELRGRNSFFLLEEGGELAGILEMQAVGDLGDRQGGTGQKLSREGASVVIGTGRGRRRCIL